MKIPLIVLVVTFIAGVALGISLDFGEKNSPDIGKLSSPSKSNGDESQYPQNVDLPAITVKNDIRSKSDHAQDIGDSKEKKAQLEPSNEVSEEKLSPAEILVKYPPPHLTDQNFFGSAAANNETILLRKQLHNEYITAMREDGVSEQDIQAAIEAFENDIANNTSDENSYHNNEIKITPEEQDYDFAQSLLEAGESQENIQQMVNDQKLTRDMDDSLTQESEMLGTDTGLLHPEPERHSE